jgi:hypothetical protein
MHIDGIISGEKTLQIVKKIEIYWQKPLKLTANQQYHPLIFKFLQKKTINFVNFLSFA